MYPTMRHRDMFWMFLVTVVAILSMSSTVTAQDPSNNGQNCATGYFGANCTGVCHCLSSDHCRSDGLCMDYQCDRGWTGAPYCQQACQEGYFGANCEFQCHCIQGDTCDKVNGICKTFQCDPNWTGASCQVRLPRLRVAPFITNITCDAAYVKFRRWKEGDDIGVPPVASYTLQISINGSAWITIVKGPNTPGIEVFEIEMDKLIEGTTYSWRVVTNRLENNKEVVGVPSPPSAEIMPNCYVPTTEPPTTTTEPTTTTTQPTTIISTTTIVTTNPDTTTQRRTTAAESTVIPTTVPTTVTTTVPPEKPDEVRNVTVSIDQSGRVFVHWNAPSDSNWPVLQYKLDFQQIGIGNCETKLGPLIERQLVPTITSFELQGLGDWTEYRVWVRAINVAGLGPTSTQTFITREIVPTGTVQKVTHTKLTATSVVFSWDAVPCSQRGGILAHYDVSVRNTRTNAETTLRATAMPFTISTLMPYTQYGVRISLVNKVGTGPPTVEYSFTTSEAAPPPPVNFRVTESTSSSLKVTWGSPVPLTGLIKEYTIRLRTDKGVLQPVIQPVAEGNSRTVTGLLPNTLYFLQIQATNGAGPGNLSQEISYRTNEGKPSAPKHFLRVYRNDTCFSLTWHSPDTPNGQITKYEIHYKILRSHSTSATDETTVVIDGHQNQTFICSLKPASQYQMSIKAFTAQGNGPSAALDISQGWTVAGNPEPPPAPTLLGFNTTSIKLRLHPLILSSGPVSWYIVVVDPRGGISRRKKRYTVQGPAYITAKLPPGFLRRATDFTVGDDKVYDGYQNKPLLPNSRYSIEFVVGSVLDGIEKTASSRLPQIVETRDPTTPRPKESTTKSVTPEKITSTPKISSSVIPQTTTPTAEPTKADNTMLIIYIAVPLAVLFILLIIVIIVVVLCMTRKNSSGEGEPKPAWLTYYTNRFYSNGNLTKSHGGWSDIWDLEEPRYLTLKEHGYVPDDLKVSDIYHNRPAISFEQEYYRLPRGQHYPWKVAIRKENRDRNRFNHLLAYDHSRVVLPRKHGSDYINANYINGYEHRNAYIAAQSPYSEITIYTFWLMVLEEQTAQIVFLAHLIEDGIVKSEQYWPDGGPRQYGDIVVSHIKTDRFASFIIRTFEVERLGQKSHRVTQYQFIDWPNHGVPEDTIPFLEFRMKVKTSMRNADVPVVVHCGTGVSRAAVYIALDSLLEQALAENVVNVYKFCESMRRNRVMMVRTLKQYIFLYDALLEALLTNNNIVGDDLKTNYRLLSNVNPITDKSYFREQFEVLEEYLPQIPEEKCKTALLESNVKKNRFPSIVPPDRYRPALRTPGGLGRTDYINALLLDSYRWKNGFIVTQTPMSSTVIDFWKLVYDYNINTIVMLNNTDFKEETCAEYWPARQGSHQWEPFFVNLTGVVQYSSATMRTLMLNNAQKPTEKAREIKQFQLQTWPMYHKVPADRRSVIDLIEMVETWRQESGMLKQPVLVHCMDGASQSGLYVASSILYEKMKIEGEVDVFHTCKQMKKRRPHLVSSLEQYKFCFKILWDHMNSRNKTRSSRMMNGHAGPSLSSSTLRMSDEMITDLYSSEI